MLMFGCKGLTSHDIGDTALEISPLVGLSHWKASHSKSLEGDSHLRRCILIYENLPNSLQGNAQFKVSPLEIKGAEIYKFISH